jgi:hypothetical protein
MATCTATKSRVFSKKGTLLFPLLSKIIKFFEQFTAKLLSAYFPFIRKEGRLVRSAFCVCARTRACACACVCVCVCVCVCAPVSPFNSSIFTNLAMNVMLLKTTLNAKLFNSPQSALTWLNCEFA